MSGGGADGRLAAPASNGVSAVAAPAASPDGHPAAPATNRGADGRLTAVRDAPVGGQAVLEGVMMRGVSHWAVAVRKPVEPESSDATPAEADRADVAAGVGEIAV